MSPQETSDLAHKRAEIGASRRVGGPLLVGALFDGAGLGRLIETLDTRHEFDLRQALSLALTAQLLGPGSKRSVHRLQHHLIRPPHVAEIKYHHLLATLDVLAKHQRHVELARLDHVRRFYDPSGELALIVHDLSSTCFEDDLTRPLRSGRLARRRRRHRPFVLFLVITNSGFPIACRVRRGALADVEALQRMVSPLRADFPISQMTVVADREVFTDAQLKALERLGYQYMLSLRDVPRARARSLLGRAEGQQACLLPDGLKVWPLQETEGDHYLVLHRPDRAEQTLGTLERNLDQTRKRLQQLARHVASGRVRREHTIASHAHRILRDTEAAPFFTFEAKEGEFSFQQDDAMLRQWRSAAGNSIWRARGLEPDDQMLASSGFPLHPVFDALRILTCRLGLRPVRHQNEQRVIGHCILCILAGSLYQSLRHALRAAGVDLSADEALRLCDQVRTAPVILRERTLWPNPRVSTQASQVLRAVGVRNPAAEIKRLVRSLEGMRPPPPVILVLCSGKLSQICLVCRMYLLLRA